MNQLWRLLPWAVVASVLPVACSGSETSTCSGVACGGGPHEAGSDSGTGEAASGSSGDATASTAGAGGASVAGSSNDDSLIGGAGTSGSAVGGSSGETDDGGRRGDGGHGGDGGGAGDGGEVREPPTVLILVDGSSSMGEATATAPSPWAIVQGALLDGMDGALKPFADRIRFGFTTYRGSNVSHAESDPACATLISVGFSVDNYDAIASTYESISFSAGAKWETPTGHAVRRATEQLLADPSTGKKYIVLLTDGEPSTCQVLDPSCGQDLVIAAVQAAYSQGIVTRTIGLVGDGSVNTGCEPTSGRCGLDHIQDVANAGSGQPVHAPPETYKYQACVTSGSGGLIAEYAVEGGSAPAPTADSAAELATLLQMQFQEILDE